LSGVHKSVSHPAELIDFVAGLDSGACRRAIFECIVVKNQTVTFFDWSNTAPLSQESINIITSVFACDHIEEGIVIVSLIERRQMLE
jgi:hypothetical protein